MPQTGDVKIALRTLLELDPDLGRSDPRKECSLELWNILATEDDITVEQIFALVLDDHFPIYEVNWEEALEARLDELTNDLERIHLLEYLSSFIGKREETRIENLTLTLFDKMHFKDKEAELLRGTFDSAFNGAYGEANELRLFIKCCRYLLQL